VPDCVPDVPFAIPGADILATLPKTINAPHLLLVDDDLFLRELVAESLRDAGYEVHEADDGRDALAAIMRARPLVLITDCNMPNMTGNELVATLARDERLCSIPAIVISALKQPSLPTNVIVFLTKPFTLKQLQAAVRDCLATTQNAA
jgi:CheY-like chemotaxis protein